jgi:ABC-2 type transport system permease protein
MSQFTGVLRHEFSMSIRRKGLWIAYGLLFLFYSVSLLSPSADGKIEILAGQGLWAAAGLMLYRFNLFLPLVGGILAADRLQRDSHIGVRELQISTPLSRPVYILSKYLGVLLSILTPVLLWVLAIAIVAIANGEAPISLLGIMVLAFLAIAAPAYAFVAAFSLAIPLVLPLRVYQVLFTGYWFWGNFLNPDAFPTLNGTLLTPGGIFAMEGFFGAYFGQSGSALHTPAEAWLNLLVLAACIVAVLFSLDRYLNWQLRRA